METHFLDPMLDRSEMFQQLYTWVNMSSKGIVRVFENENEDMALYLVQNPDTRGKILAALAIQDQLEQSQAASQTTTEGLGLRSQTSGPKPASSSSRATEDVYGDDSLPDHDLADLEVGNKGDTNADATRKGQDAPPELPQVYNIVVGNVNGARLKRKRAQAEAEQRVAKRQQLEREQREREEAEEAEGSQGQVEEAEETGDSEEQVEEEEEFEEEGGEEKGGERSSSLSLGLEDVQREEEGQSSEPEEVERDPEVEEVSSFPLQRNRTVARSLGIYSRLVVPDSQDDEEVPLELAGNAVPVSQCENGDSVPESIPSSGLYSDNHQPAETGSQHESMIAAKSAEQPSTKNTEQPSTKSTEQPSTKSTEQPSTKSTEQPSTKSTEQPSTKSTEQSSAKSTEQPPTKTTGQLPARANKTLTANTNTPSFSDQVNKSLSQDSEEEEALSQEDRDGSNSNEELLHTDSDQDRTPNRSDIQAWLQNKITESCNLGVKNTPETTQRKMITNMLAVAGPQCLSQWWDIVSFWRMNGTVYVCPKAKVPTELNSAGGEHDQSLLALDKRHGNSLDSYGQRQGQIEGLQRGSNGLANTNASESSYPSASAPNPETNNTMINNSWNGNINDNGLGYASNANLPNETTQTPPLYSNNMIMISSQNLGNQIRHVARPDPEQRSLQQTKPWASRFIKAYRSAEEDEVVSYIQPILQRYNLLELHHAYEDATKHLLKSTTGDEKRARGRAKDELFKACFRQWDQIDNFKRFPGAPYNGDRAKFDQHITAARRISILQTQLGEGVFGLIPDVSITRDWLYRKLNKGQFELWVLMIKELNWRFRMLKARAQELVKRGVSGLPLAQDCTKRLLIERITRESVFSTPRLCDLLNECDPTITSDTAPTPPQVLLDEPDNGADFAYLFADETNGMQYGRQNECSLGYN